MSFLPGLWRTWINRSAAGPFLNADSLNDWEAKFRALDCLGAVRALGLVDALPGSSVDGDAYLTSAAATPANKLVRHFGGAWESFTPPNGMVAWLPDGSAKQFLSGAWGDADFGGGAVASVFGRTGAVAAQTGDYTAAQVGAEPALPADGTAAQYLTGLKAWADFATAVRSTALTGLSTASSAVVAATDSVLQAIGRLQAQVSLRLMAHNPEFTGALKQGGTTRITSSGSTNFEALRVSNLSSAFNGVLTSDYAGIVGVRGAADFRDNYIQAAASDHNHFSKLDVSASTTIGSIDATAIKVTTTDVILTLSGGVDGQGWDIINPTASIGIAIPSGAKLWKSIGSDVGPTTIAIGGGRPIRITRIDANTWIMLGSQ